MCEDWSRNSHTRLVQNCMWMVSSAAMGILCVCRQKMKQRTKKEESLYCFFFYFQYVCQQEVIIVFCLNTVPKHATNPQFCNIPLMLSELKHTFSLNTCTHIHIRGRCSLLMVLYICYVMFFFRLMSRPCQKIHKLLSQTWRRSPFTSGSLRENLLLPVSILGRSNFFEL